MCTRMDQLRVEGELALQGFGSRAGRKNDIQRSQELLLLKS